MASRLSLALVALLGLAACEATDPLNSAMNNAAFGPDVPDASIFSRETPVAFVELEGPMFYTYYNPDHVNAAGILFHSHKNCPGTPRNYAFPLSEAEKLGADLHRRIMACQYGYN